MRHGNLEDSRQNRSRLGATLFDEVVKKLTGPYSIGQGDPSVLFFDANGADRTIFLPQIETGAGQIFFVGNYGVANSLVVKDFGGVDIASVTTTSKLSIFVSYPGGWTAGSVGSPGPAGAPGSDGDPLSYMP